MGSVETRLQVPLLFAIGTSLVAQVDPRPKNLDLPQSPVKESTKRLTVPGRTGIHQGLVRT